ncbi:MULTISPECIES: hypothetical protein [Catenuloplanes]|uniref:Uncharacterized protein n=1 Tax=Catenuloplanes niger TaxID=587534 RepID=A0AAE3ZT55_9ACTN|nr:hypothetical protein [Catenuloplanes niger]MDR7325372.1 hypothetical protein [Catenuloplanes niger]
MTSAPHVRRTRSLPGSGGCTPAPPGAAGFRATLRRLLAAAGRVDDRAVARLIGDALETDGTLDTWAHLCAPALAATAGPANAPELALAAGIRAALDERLIRLARRDLAPTVMLTAPPGEPGDLPLTALAVVLLEHGVESWRLGADVPWAAISDAVARVAPDRLVVWSGGARGAELAELVAGHPAVAIVPAGPAVPLAETAAACLAATAR